MQQQEEIWKDIPGYEGKYQVSNLGNVKSLNYNHTKKERVLKLGKNPGGYLMIVLCKENKKQTKTIHQLVAITFLNHIPCGPELVINHKNFNKLDNRVENLEIVTNRENTNRKHLKSTSKYVGVCWDKRTNKWISQIVIKSSVKFLGRFETEEQASEAYQNKLKELKQLN
jgi:hypothetical protein